MIFYWYFISYFNYDIKHKERSWDSTQSRDQPTDLETDYQILPESQSPTTEIIRSIRQQIHFQQNNHIDEIPTTSTFAGNITHISQDIINLPVYVNIPHRYEPLNIQQDKQLEEFLRGEIHCQNFINQDLTFLQTSVIHAPQPMENKTLSQGNTVEISPIEIIENNPPHEKAQTSNKLCQQKLL